MVFLSDIVDLEIPFLDSKEPMACLRGLPGVEVDESRSRIANRSDFFCYARGTVAGMLAQASRRLPPGYSLRVMEAYRPLSQQKRSFEGCYARYAEMHPGLPARAVREMVSSYVAPVEVAGHPSGGAVDVTLAFGGAELDMGTEFNAEPGESEQRTYMDAENIGEEQRRRRTILREIMGGVGFVNYPSEWWHWSYGDAYWAYMTGNARLYGAMDEEEIAGASLNRSR